MTQSQLMRHDEFGFDVWNGSSHLGTSLGTKPALDGKEERWKECTSLLAWWSCSNNQFRKTYPRLPGQYTVNSLPG